MALHVTQIKTPRGIVLPQNNRIFDHRGGTMGRADNNTWVLPDPDRFLSSCHCEIVCVNNLFYLEDKSTNGTFVNDGLEPIGRGIRHQLRDGDLFDIGDYRFSVKLASQSLGTVASPFDLASAYANSTAPFNSSSNTDFFGETGNDVANLFEQSSQDPLALWDKKAQSLSSSSFDAAAYPSAHMESNALLDSFVGLGSVTRDNDFQTMEVSTGMDQAVSWPSAGAENLIPEDWAGGASQPASLHIPEPKLKDPFVDDSLNPFSLLAIGATDARLEIPGPNTELDAPPNNASLSLEELIFSTGVPLDKSNPLKTSGAKQNFNASTAPVAMAIDAISITPTSAVKPQLQTQNTQALQPANSSQASSHNQILIEALGLDASRLSTADINEISRLSGLLIREIVDGMLGVLRSRANIKNEFRMNVTTIQSVENNPLKFSVNVDDALECLFIKKSNAYQKPVDAFREGFQEIAEHQLAMIAGLRQGFEGMMERFDPQQLEKNFNRQAKTSVIPSMQKAKNWSGYTDYYQGLAGNMERSFQHLFGSDFVSAYEDQLRRLMAARKRGELNDDV